MSKRNLRYAPAFEYSRDEVSVDNHDTNSYSEEPEIEIDEEVELEPVEEVTIEVPQDEEPIEEPQPVVESYISEKDAALKLIAGEFGTNETDIRNALSEIGHDYDKIVDVKMQILNGTYF